MLNNPVYATTVFNAINIALYVTVVSASSTTTTMISTTDDGGAGAF
ncbi:hypothetical protein JOC34_002999 [Virgibacillus halotolerans]|nr:hypothetical protein [Virgibacillus halotolerans]